MKTIQEWTKDIERALKQSNSYSKSLNLQIMTLASALRTLELANAEIEKLDDTTVLEKTRYGEKLAPHPVFKVQRDAQDSITRQMKALGLVADALAGEIEEDPLVDLTKKVKDAGKAPRIVRRE